MSQRKEERCAISAVQVFAKIQLIGCGFTDPRRDASGGCVEKDIGIDFWG